MLVTSRDLKHQHFIFHSGLYPTRVSRSGVGGILFTVITQSSTLIEEKASQMLSVTTWERKQSVVGCSMASSRFLPGARGLTSNPISLAKTNYVTSLTENSTRSSHVAVSEWRKRGNQYQCWMYYTGTMLDTGSDPGRSKTSQGSRWSMAYVQMALKETSSCQDWFFSSNMGKISPNQGFILGFFMGIIVSSREFIRTPNINFGCYSLVCCTLGI